MIKRTDQDLVDEEFKISKQLSSKYIYNLELDNQYKFCANEIAFELNKFKWIKNGKNETYFSSSSNCTLKLTTDESNKLIFTDTEMQSLSECTGNILTIDRVSSN